MSEERLKEIKDSIDLQMDACKIFKQDNELTLEELVLYNEVIRLREELSKCTRKHWQSKCAEHCINEKLLQIKIDKAIEYIEELTKPKRADTSFHHNPIYVMEMSDLLNILRGEDK